MALEERQTQTNSNVREKANLIWEIATHLYGEYKPHEYGRVILPMTVIKRFDDCLKETKQKVLEQASKVANMATGTKDAVLQNASGYAFYNTSKFDFEKLLADSENIAENFTDYLSGFSDNVRDIISYFEFDKEIAKMSQNDLLFTIIQEFNSKKANMSPSVVSSQDMGYIFEELVRKFSESYDEQAGAHFTSRDIIYLMTELLIANEKEILEKLGSNKTAYDMTMGTSQMLACLDERLKDLNSNINLICYGQEFNPETFAIAKADMLIKGGNADNMKFGDTLSNDQFENYSFDYIISNPPFGIDWKKEQSAVIAESKLGFDGRFGPGLPGISDGQMLFLLNGVKKLKDTGRMAIIQNGSSLFSGDAGSGPSEIRKYLIENDLLEAIIELPNDLFYNTGISTYIWVISKNKSEKRKGKIQLINALECYSKRRKNIGSKRVDLDDDCIKMIIDSYNTFSDNSIKNCGGKIVESKIFENSEFGYIKIAVDTAETNEDGSLVFKKGKPVIIKGKTDYEIISLKANVKNFMDKNVIPHNPGAIYYCDKNGDVLDSRKNPIDDKHTKIGYEIPFTKLFYKFVAPRSSAVLFNELKELCNEENGLLNKLIG